MSIFLTDSGVFRVNIDAHQVCKKKLPASLLRHINQRKEYQHQNQVNRLLS